VQLNSVGERLIVTFTAASPEVEAALREGAEELVEAIVNRSERWTTVEVRLESDDGEDDDRRPTDQDRKQRREKAPEEEHQEQEP
jgi:hypothetical protein